MSSTCRRHPTDDRRRALLELLGVVGVIAGVVAVAAVVLAVVILAGLGPGRP